VTRVLVIGGRGYFGARVVESLRRLDGVEPTATREVDLLDPATFPAMGRFDAVVDCADSVRAPPDAAAAWALAHGVPFFEMSADAPTAERLLALPPGTGTLVVGVGLFPGLSTALAHALGAARRVDVAVRLSPLSGAGPGNCELMTASLSVPSVRYENGRRIEGPAVGAALRLPFAGGRAATAIGVGLPDVALVRHATGVPDVAAWMALVPGAMRLSFRLLAALVRLAGPLVRPLVTASLKLSRGLLLRRVPTAVQITVVADRGLPGERAWRVSVPDGREATAAAVAAALDLWRVRGAPPGVHAAGALFPAPALLDRMRALGVAVVDERP
jgi:hypothetical protein